jgi:hypothetical protein
MLCAVFLVPGSPFPINSFESYTSSEGPTSLPAGTTIALFLYNLQDWLPGVAGPNLDSVPVFWGVSSKKGACTSPLFYFSFCSSWWLAGAEALLPASVSSKWFRYRARIRSGPFSLPAPTSARARHSRRPFRASVSRALNFQPFRLGPREAARQKNERPVGGPAARAWGMEGLAT